MSEEATTSKSVRALGVATLCIALGDPMSGSAQRWAALRSSLSTAPALTVGDRLRRRQRESKLSVTRPRLGDHERAAMGLSDSTRDGQTETDAIVRRRIARSRRGVREPYEPLEDAISLSLRNPLPLVDDSDVDGSVASLHENLYETAARRMLDRVVE